MSDAADPLSAERDGKSVILRHFVNNVALLKARILGMGEITLLPDEEALLLHDDPGALSRLTQVPMEEIACIERLLLQRASWSSVESQIIDHINAIFRFTFEELLLRWNGTVETRNAKYAAQSVLSAAVERQRQLMSESRRERDLARQSLADMEKKYEDCQRRVAQLEAGKKADFDAYVREVCVLKEQLLKSYKDKGYVGRPVDLLHLVIDNDTGEDVSVDELLRCRRQMRGFEAQTNALQEQILSLQADVSGKVRFIKRLEDRSRAAEAVAHALHNDMDTLSAANATLQQELRISKDEVTSLRNVIGIIEEAQRTRRAHANDVSVQADLHRSADGDDHRVIPKDSKQRSERPGIGFPTAGGERESEEQVNLPHIVRENRTPRDSLQPTPPLSISNSPLSHPLFAAHGDATSAAAADPTPTPVIVTPVSQHVLGPSDVQQLQETISATQHSLDLASKNYLDAKAVIEQRDAEIARLSDQLRKLEEQLASALDAARMSETARLTADDSRKQAEARADSVVAKCAAHSEVLAAEMAASTEALQTLQRRNIALCRAFANVSHKLDQLKTRAGLHDYKQRSNQFHFHRAEAVISAARDEAAARQAECERRESVAESSVKLAEHVARLAIEDAKAQEQAHTHETQELAQRTADVQLAFEALLADFNRLRDDYLKTAGSAALEQVNQQAALSSLDASNRFLTSATLSDRSGAAEAYNGPRFVFEGVHLSPSDDFALQVTKYALDSAAASPPEDAPVLPEADPGEDGTGHDVSGEAKAQVNTAILSLVPRLCKDYAVLYSQLHNAFAGVYKLERAVLAKEFSIAAAEKALCQLEPAEGPGGKSASKVKRKTLAAEHAKFVANRNLAVERAGLREQKILAAWEKLRLLTAVDAIANASLETARSTMATSGLVKVVTPAPVQTEISLQDLSHESPLVTVAASSPQKSFRVARLPKAKTPGPLQGEEQHSMHASRERAASGDVGSPSRSTLPDVRRNTTRRGDDDLLAPPKAAILVGTNPPHRRGSTGEISLAHRSTSRWGGGNPPPSVVVPQGLPALLAPSLQPLMMASRVAAAASLDASTPEDTGSFSHAWNRPPSVQDLPFGDVASVDAALSQLHEHLSRPPGPLATRWQKQKKSS